MNGTSSIAITHQRSVYGAGNNPETADRSEVGLKAGRHRDRAEHRVFVDKRAGELPFPTTGLLGDQVVGEMASSIDIWLKPSHTGHPWSSMLSW